MSGICTDSHGRIPHLRCSQLSSYFPENHRRPTEHMSKMAASSLSGIQGRPTLLSSILCLWKGLCLFLTPSSLTPGVGAFRRLIRHHQPSAVPWNILRRKRGEGSCHVLHTCQDSRLGLSTVYTLLNESPQSSVTQFLFSPFYRWENLGSWVLSLESQNFGPAGCLKPGLMSSLWRNGTKWQQKYFKF